MLTFAAVAGALALSGALAWWLLLRPSVLAQARPEGALLSGELAHDGWQRRYRLYLPAGHGRIDGLLVLLHGAHGSGARFREWTGRAFDALADHHRFAVLYPDGVKAHWNDCRRAGDYAAKRLGIDDVGFLDALVRHAVQARGVQATRVGVLGYSNGGAMALRWAAEGRTALSGLVLVAANVPADDNFDCAPRRALPPALLIAGTRDRINPYVGGRVTLLGSDRGCVRSAPASARWLAGIADGGDPADLQASMPRSDSRPMHVHRHHWTRARPDRGDAELITVHGAGHTLPQPRVRFPRLLGPTFDGFDGPAYAVAHLGWSDATPGS